MTLNLSALVSDVQDTDEPIVRAKGAGRPAIDNPFGPVIRDSFDNGKSTTDKDGKTTTVGKTKVLTVIADPTRGKTGEPSNVTTIKGLIRRAADDQGLGVKIVLTDGEQEGAVTVASVDDEGNPVMGEDGEPVMEDVQQMLPNVTIRFAAKDKTERTRTAAPAAAVVAPTVDYDGNIVPDESADEGADDENADDESADESADDENADESADKPKRRRSRR